MNKLLINGLSVLLPVICLTVSATVTAREELQPNSEPKIVTVGKPSDSAYANAGENYRSGVGSIFIAFTEGGFICTASAISPTHLLTAAHCVRNVTEEGAPDTIVQLLFVPPYCEEAACAVPASGFAANPLFDAFSPIVGAFAPGDVAVIELAEALPDDVEYYELYAEPDEMFQETRHYGHGRSGRGNKGATGGADFYYARTGLNQYEQVLGPLLAGLLPDFLLPLFDQLLHDFDSGGRKHNAMEWWFTSSFACHPENPDNPGQAQDGKCTTFKDGSYPDFKGFGKFEIGIAPGDSGGPGFIDGKIAGVHSFGFTHICGGAGGPTNTTDFDCELNSSYGEMAGDARVSSHIDWIEAQMLPETSLVPIPEPVPALPAENADAALLDAAELRLLFDQVLSRNLRMPAEGL